MSIEQQERLFNSLLADVKQALKARAEIQRYISKDEIAMLERNGFRVGYFNPKGFRFTMARISAEAA